MQEATAVRKGLLGRGQGGCLHRPHSPGAVGGNVWNRVGSTVVVWSRKLGPGVGALSLAASRKMKSVNSAPLWSTPLLRGTPSPQHPPSAQSQSDQPDRQGLYPHTVTLLLGLCPWALSLKISELSQSPPGLFSAEELGKMGQHLPSPESDYLPPLLA